ncbi:Protein translocase subunit SecA [hydrothermal vent metagenome]|uniref:Protein translocase subunit SecA n=1 Tax=hydrothermal vent metagenome TaxID=652676 RepID=A0A3B0VVK5_9ZZZZ
MILNTVVTKLFGSRNQRHIKQLYKTVDLIDALESKYQAMRDGDLKNQTQVLKDRIATGESLDAILVDAFAVVREASVRVMEMRHYRQQMLGGMVLHNGKIAEMRTGEGKTLVATLPAYLNALTGKGVHIVTVNDYLASRDAKWMEPLYNFLGMQVGVVVPEMTQVDKRAAYGADITYGTNNEYGFDYLRDNMAFTLEEKVQKEPHFAIVDEVDSILIDEARTPLIISGQTDDSPELYHRINRLTPKLVASTQKPIDTGGGMKAMIAAKKEEALREPDGDYTIDEKAKQVHLTEQGMEKVEQLFKADGLIKDNESLYDSKHLQLIHHINAALRAQNLYQKDVDYILENGEVVIVDEFTGRTLAGRRWGEGLHQAVEAKENVPVQKENQTLASVTFQNYFRLYPKLSGMTGTADTEAYEFHTIYGLEVVVIPTNKPMIRDDQGDLVFLTMEGKLNAIIDDIKDSFARQQPALVGTASIEVSELISKKLDEQKIPHNVLNAKQHEKEALIVAKAGKPGSITIATNMAGRGTDIVLGGNLEIELAELGDQISEAKKQDARDNWQSVHDSVLEKGGLRIIGTERHESRRIDNQLRGRSGRQGDPGSSRFYISLEDNLMRIFGGNIATTMRKFGMAEDESIEHKWISRTIESAQRKVESHNFDIRKSLLEYDDVANDQRLVIYQQRIDLLESEEIQDFVVAIREEVFEDIIRTYIPIESIEEQWYIQDLERALKSDYGIDINIQRWLDNDADMNEHELVEKIHKNAERFFREKEAITGSQTMRQFERAVYLNVLDQLWKEHLLAMDHLRQGIGLRGYAQKQPIQEFKKESFEMFTNLLDRIKTEVTKIIARVKIQEEDVNAMEQQKQQNMEYQHDAAQNPTQPQEQKEPTQVETYVRQGKKVGRNEPCPCGSGKKYKQCHGKLT